MRASFDGRPASAAYASAFRRFRELPGFDQRAVLRAELASIIKAWAGRTKVSTPSTVELNTRTRAIRQAAANRAGAAANYTSINTGRRGPPGRVWFRHYATGKFSLAGQVDFATGAVRFNNLHFRNDDWSGIVETINRAREAYRTLLPLAEQSIGLARQSVIQIADGLNIDLEQVAGQGISSAGIRKARAAIASNGRAYRNGYGSEAGNEVRYYVAGFTRLPYGAKIGMDRELAGVLARRAKFIETAYSKGAFDSMARVSASFPNFVRFNAGIGLN